MTPAEQQVADAAEARGHAERLAIAIQAEGFPARVWSAPGLGSRVYVRAQYVSISRGGDVSRTHRGAATWLPTAFYARERPRLERAFAAYRAETSRLLDAAFAALDLVPVDIRPNP